MKVGDLVRKIEGVFNLNKVGMITKVYNTVSKKGFPIIEVLLEGELVNWASHCVEVVDESR